MGRGTSDAGEVAVRRGRGWRANPQAQTESRRLRSEQGLSVKTIAAQLGVSPASVSAWTRDIVLTEEQREAMNRTQAIGRSQAAQRRRKAWQSLGRERAKQGDPLHMAGCMLYWAEGSKTRNSVVISNTDPDLLLLFMRFLETEFGVTREMYSMSVYCYEDAELSVDELERYWLEVLNLPETSIRQAITKTGAANSKRVANGPGYGVCRIAVDKTKIVQQIYGAIQEYGAFDRPDWLGEPISS